MNKMIKLAIAALTVVWLSFSQAQPPKVGMPTALDDIEQAAMRAKTVASPALIDGLRRAASNQEAAFANIYATVPKDERVARLAEYLYTKENSDTARGDAGRGNIDVRDFNWGYLAHDIRYVGTPVESAVAAKLLRIELPTGKPLVFDAAVEKTGANFVVPATYLTATFAVGSKKVFWSGVPSNDAIRLISASTGQGCEIHIESEPPGARIFVNKKEFYKKTNTALVRMREIGR
jgi:hypothetical protein